MELIEMQDALLQLAFEMTASVETANSCIIDMDLEGEEQLFDVAQYLKFLVHKAQQENNQ